MPSPTTPITTLDSPASGTTIEVGELVRFQVTGRDDPAHGVSRIDLRVGNVLVASEHTTTLTPQQSFTTTLESPFPPARAGPQGYDSARAALCQCGVRGCRAAGGSHGSGIFGHDSATQVP
ncbi:MAG: hypothetical protein H0V12_06300 [Chloroflexi bacterium]|nr:hypothetical protein [Chloroflexota bacterium]